MLLAIDVGNTNSVFALHDGTAYLADWRCATDVKRTADEYFVWLRQLMDHHGVSAKQIDAVVISSTAAGTMFNLRVLADRYFGVRPIVVGKPETAVGIDVRVDPGTRVGADRLVNTLSAWRTYGGEVIVIDFGTATTIDVVGEDGAYEGGIIAPGVNLALKALETAATALPEIDVTKPEKVIGLNTVACMQSGIYWGYVSLIEGLCRRIMDERGRKMKVIATGGLSPLFARGTDVIDAVDGDLTLRGLAAIYELNKQGKT
ncbi:type III pantothenate kinase [Albimonas pacifica]|uniref:Type III pantothenate kinase n=1 Tax=Albimonas pacifica TaxID=1114924 RepID=A0A1I3KPQ1_9RHOB|nr:type III pantothenate kinase [Albimonas pacifica]SFI74493.1 type III pantothenate kinase [Albimonas pacifica]